MASLSLRDIVCDKADERHHGKIERIEHGIAHVRWIETGWRSVVPAHNLKRVRERAEITRRIKAQRHLKKVRDA